MAINRSFGIQDFPVGFLKDFKANPLTEGEKDLAIQKVIDDANKKYGKGALVRGADARGLKINRLKTGSIALDVATGGGWAWGKLNEIFGQFSGGKSYVSMLTMAQTQRDYPEANIALIDFEGAFDAEWAKKIGVDVDNLIISSPEYMEDGLQIAIDLIHSGDCALIVVDSLAAACPKAEYTGDITDFTVGLRARLGNKFVRKSKGKIDLTNEELDLGQTTILVVNQTYKNIGGYGDPDVTPGGEQVKFGAMIRVKIRKGEVINDTKDGTQIMQESRFSVVKNKTYPPHKAGAFWFSTQDNPKGKAGEIYRTGEIITYGILTGVISRSGAWYTLPEEFGLEKSLQGEAAVADWVVENPDKYPRLEEMVMNSILKGNENE
jgi:recombination protein RecA